MNKATLPAEYIAKHPVVTAFGTQIQSARFPFFGCFRLRTSSLSRFSSTWILCLLTVLMFIGEECFLSSSSLFAQMPSTTGSQTVTVVQPNRGERLQSGREYLILWTGIDSLTRVRIDYSINGGASWIFITDTARNGSYLWKPVPNTPSDSCLIQVSAAAGDSTVPVGRTLVSTSVPATLYPALPSSNYPGATYGYPPSFSPDGTKIFITQSTNPVYSSAYFYGFKQQNTEVRDGRTGRTLYSLPPYISDAVNTSRFLYGWIWGGGWGWGGGGNISSSASRWTSDNSSFLYQLTDTTVGLMNAQTGALQQTYTIQTRGNVSRIATFQFTGNRQEIVVTVQDRFFGSIGDGSYDTLRTRLLRLNASNGAPANMPFDISYWHNRACSYGWNGWGYSGISNDGERIFMHHYDTVRCSYLGSSIRSTRTNAVIHDFPNTGMTNFWNANNWNYFGGANVWSPNDSLIVAILQPLATRPILLFFYDTYTGTLVKRCTTSSYANWSYYSQGWSPDSKLFMLDANVNNTVVLTVLCQEKRFEKTRKKHDLSGFNHEPEKGNRYASSGVFFAIQCLALSLYALCIVPTRLRDSCGHDALTR